MAIADGRNLRNADQESVRCGNAGAAARPLQSEIAASPDKVDEDRHILHASRYSIPRHPPPPGDAPTGG